MNFADELVPLGGFFVADNKVKIVSVQGSVAWVDDPHTDIYMTSEGLHYRTRSLRSVSANFLPWHQIAYIGQHVEQE